MIPGEIVVLPGEIVLNGGSAPRVLGMSNTGDRPIAVGSHMDLGEVNGALALDRAAARGMRLDIPAGSSVRLEPGSQIDVAVIPIHGAHRIEPQ